MIGLKKLRFTIGLVICFLVLISFVSSVKARRKNIIGIAAFSNHVSIEGGGYYPLQTSITPPVLYFGRSFGMITILGNISYCYRSWQKVEEERRGWRISSVTPLMSNSCIIRHLYILD